MAMFGTNDKEESVVAPVSQSEDTIIGSTIKIEGDLVSDGNIVVEGEVVGTLKTGKSLHVGQQAKVSADVTAVEALIAGELTGNIDVSDKIELTETAKVNGDLKAKIVTIKPGAIFNGRCTMTGGVAVVSDKKTDQAEEKKDEASESKEA